jgi:hypothetical protein
LPNIIGMIKSRKMRWAGNVVRMAEKRNAYRILVGKQEGKRPLGRPRRRWVDNIKMDLRETGWDGMAWIDLVQDGDQWRALVNTVMNLRVTQNVGKFMNSCTTGGFSRSQLVRTIMPGSAGRVPRFLPFNAIQSPYWQRRKATHTRYVLCTRLYDTSS